MSIFNSSFINKDGKWSVHIKRHKTKLIWTLFFFVYLIRILDEICIHFPKCIHFITFSVVFNIIKNKNSSNVIYYSHKEVMSNSAKLFQSYLQYGLHESSYGKHMYVCMWNTFESCGYVFAYMIHDKLSCGMLDQADCLFQHITLCNTSIQPQSRWNSLCDLI